MTRSGRSSVLVCPAAVQLRFGAIDAHVVDALERARQRAQPGRVDAIIVGHQDHVAYARYTFAARSCMLLNRARACKSTPLRAYAPYSHFRVGAALEDANGASTSAATWKTASYGLTICAERNAIFAAIAARRTAAVSRAGGGLPRRVRGGARRAARAARSSPSTSRRRADLRRRRRASSRPPSCCRTPSGCRRDASRAARARDFEALERGPLDVLIIGGGIVGTGIARDLALRGLKVALVEQHDLASGTSSRPTRLIHGGLRYLEMFDFGLVRTDMREREVLLRLAPHLVQPLRFLMPMYGRGVLYRAKLQAGMQLYDALSFDKSLPTRQWLNTRQVLRAEPGLEPDRAAGRLAVLRRPGLAGRAAGRSKTRWMRRSAGGLILTYASADGLSPRRGGRASPARSCATRSAAARSQRPRAPDGQRHRALARPDHGRHAPRPATIAAPDQGRAHRHALGDAPRPRAVRPARRSAVLRHPVAGLLAGRARPTPTITAIRPRPRRPKRTSSTWSTRRAAPFLRASSTRSTTPGPACAPWCASSTSTKARSRASTRCTITAGATGSRASCRSSAARSPAIGPSPKKSATWSRASSATATARRLDHRAAPLPGRPPRRPADVRRERALAARARRSGWTAQQAEHLGSVYGSLAPERAGARRARPTPRPNACVRTQPTILAQLERAVESTSGRCRWATCCCDARRSGCTRVRRSTAWTTSRPRGRPARLGCRRTRRQIEAYRREIEPMRRFSRADSLA